MLKLQRYENNPILKPNPKNKWESQAVFNPGVLYKNGKIYLLYRAVGEYEKYISRMGLAISEDGFHFKRASNKPVFSPGKKYDLWAAEDPRVTEIEGIIYITYVAFDKQLRGANNLYQEAKTALLSTKNFRTFKRHGIISPPHSDNKDIVLFPEKIKGKFVALHRPSYWSRQWFNNPLSKRIKVDCPFPVQKLPELPSIWLAYTYNFKKWFGHQLLLAPSEKENEKIGAGPPPLRIKEGWLMIYHQVEKNKKGNIKYSAKIILLDANNPARIIAKIPKCILEPKKLYERKGDVDRVVFPTGNIIKDGRLFVYYGAADKYCAVATKDTNKIKEALEQNSV